MGTVSPLSARITEGKHNIGGGGGGDFKSEEIGHFYPIFFIHLETLVHFVKTKLPCFSFHEFHFLSGR